ncbi:MAG: hypothetical protein HC890_09770 [Chloroflexaceae bacterium]|nr:hypothetical protein [Chloroflexaceae bacterium]
MAAKTPSDTRQEEGKYDPQDNPGTETEIPTTEEGNTPLDERLRMTGQESGSDVRPGAEQDAPGGTIRRPGTPNQGTESR